MFSTREFQHMVDGAWWVVGCNACNIVFMKLTTFKTTKSNIQIVNGIFVTRQTM